MNGLDNAGVREMRELFKSLRAQGKTILLASHNPLDVEELCDTVCEMDGGGAFAGEVRRASVASYAFHIINFTL